MNLFDERTDRIAHKGFSLADMISENTSEKATEAYLSQQDMRPSVNEKPSQPVILAEVLCSDLKLFTFTGIHSLDMLDSIVKCDSDIDTVHATSKKAPSLKERIILTMIKIKLDLELYGHCHLVWFACSHRAGGGHAAGELRRCHVDSPPTPYSPYLSPPDCLLFPE